MLYADMTLNAQYVTFWREMQTGETQINPSFHLAEFTKPVILTLIKINLNQTHPYRKRLSSEPSNEYIKSDILILSSQGINLAARAPVAAFSFFFFFPSSNRHHTKADKWWS